MYRWTGLAAVMWLCGTAPPAAAVKRVVRQPQAIDSAMAAPPIAFEGVTVIDMVDGRHLADQTVLIVGSRIQAVGERSHVQIPKGARRVTARGRYLIPGLWDMHTHNLANPNFPVLGATDLWVTYLTFGITGVRDMLMTSPYDSLRQYRRNLAAGRRVGPRVVAGGYITAPLGSGPRTGWSTQVTGVGTPEEGRRAVDSLAKVGYDFIKLHSGFSPEVYFAIAAEARKIGIPFAGHPPSALVTAEEIADSGQKSVEHITYFQTILGPCTRSGAEADHACAALAAHFVQRGTWLTPTMGFGREWGPNWASFIPDSANPLASLQTADGSIWLMNRLGRFGFPLLAGTDGFIVYDRKQPPSPLHDELKMMVEAGMTPFAALQTATLNPAKYLNATDSLGTVETGKLADLVLLDADPTTDIRNVGTLRAVVANGRYLDRDALNGLIAEMRTKYEALKKALKRAGVESGD